MIQNHAILAGISKQKVQLQTAPSCWVEARIFYVRITIGIHCTIDFSADWCHTTLLQMNQNNTTKQHRFSKHVEIIKPAIGVWFKEKIFMHCGFLNRTLIGERCRHREVWSNDETTITFHGPKLNVGQKQSLVMNSSKIFDSPS